MSAISARLSVEIVSREEEDEEGSQHVKNEEEDDEEDEDDSSSEEDLMEPDDMMAGTTFSFLLKNIPPILCNANEHQSQPLTITVQ